MNPRNFSSAFIRKSALFFICLFISTVLFHSVSCNKEDEHLAIIKGNISNPVAGKIYLCSFKDSVSRFLDEKSILDSSVIDENGNYLFEIEWQRADLFDLKTENEFLITNMYLNLKEKITLNFAGEKNKPAIAIEKGERQASDYLLKFVDSFYLEPQVRKYYYVESNSLSIPQFFAYIDERQKNQIGFYYRYFSDKAPAEDFSKFAFTEIYYQGATDKLTFLWKKRMKYQKKNEDSAYYQFFKEVKIENDGALNSPAYRHFLKLYIDELYQQWLEEGNAASLNPETFSPNMEKYRIAKKHLHGIFLEMVCANLAEDEKKTLSVNREIHEATMDTLLQSLGVSMRSHFLN